MTTSLCNSIDTNFTCIIECQDRLYKQSLTINHMLFMDDLDLFGKSMTEIDSLVKTVETCCADIGMAFGIAKCAALNLKRGKLVACDGLELQSGDKIDCVVRI